MIEGMFNHTLCYELQISIMVPYGLVNSLPFPLYEQELSLPKSISACSPTHEHCHKRCIVQHCNRYGKGTTELQSHIRWLLGFHNYCRMLNVHQHLSWRFGYIWRSRFLTLASVTSGALFLYASIILGQFYLGESKEPHETRVIKFSRKLSILQYIPVTVIP